MLIDVTSISQKNMKKSTFLQHDHMHTATTKYEGAVAKLTLVFKAVTAGSGLLRLSQCSRTNLNKKWLPRPWSS